MSISTESYKGVRDFYPEEKFIQNYIFKIWRETVESFGYVAYDASVLESAELYEAKSGEEIVNEQTYTFVDRGERKVTLRPEMTPTVARMVAAKYRDLAFPLRWYSIPNLFRYEKPQRGRLREHWQLNVDLFGSKDVEADVEIISIASAIMKNFGATENDFVIKINDRRIVNALYEKFSLTPEARYRISKIIDKKEKISTESFALAIKEILGDTSEQFIHALSPKTIIETLGEDSPEIKDILGLIDILSTRGIGNIIFDPTLMRGFDYYTGTVFEVFDTAPENNRSVFGGGRYDDLLDIFGAPKVPTVGFGAGDVTMLDFLETHRLLPTYVSTTLLYICVMNKAIQSGAEILATQLRKEKLSVAVDVSGKKVGDQIKIADKQHIPYVIVVGEDEVKNNIYTLKKLSDGSEIKGSVEEIVAGLS